MSNYLDIQRLSADANVSKSWPEAILAGHLQVDFVTFLVVKWKSFGMTNQWWLNMVIQSKWSKDQIPVSYTYIIYILYSQRNLKPKN